MKEINIARTLSEKRREKGITQDALASYIGVSKASVSKWETGQSYPDITFLPQLAAYFNISIDALMGYAPQLTKEDIAKLYQQLADDFASAPFDAMMQTVDGIIRKYYACFPLLYRMGILLVNHHMLADSPDMAMDVLRKANALFIRVKEESDDVELAKQAMHMEAMCLLMLGQPQDVLALLDGTDEDVSSTQALQASACQMLGRTDEAKSLLQIGIYKHLMGLIDLLGQYLGLPDGDADRFAGTYKRARAILEAFEVTALHPAAALKFYIIAASGYAELGNREQALALFEAYVALATSNMYPLTLHGDAFFDQIQDWLGALGALPPRNEITIKKSIVEMAEHPAFASFVGDARFVQLARRLNKITEEA